MQRVQLHALILIPILAAAVWGSKVVKLPAQNSTRTDFAKIPMQIDGWAGINSGFDAQTRNLLKYASLLNRYYLLGDGKINLTVVYGTDLGEFHQPEFCLGGQGLRVLHRDAVKIRRPDGTSFTAVGLVTEDDYEKVAFIYWFSSKGTTATSLGNYKLRVLMDRLKRRQVQPSAMIRLSARVYGNESEALDQLTHFAEKLSPYLDEELKGK